MSKHINEMREMSGKTDPDEAWRCYKLEDGADDLYLLAQWFESIPDYHTQATGIRLWLLIDVILSRTIIILYKNLILKVS